MIRHLCTERQGTELGRLPTHAPAGLYRTVLQPAGARSQRRGTATHVPTGLYRTVLAPRKGWAPQPSPSKDCSLVTPLFRLLRLRRGAVAVGTSAGTPPPSILTGPRSGVPATGRPDLETVPEIMHCQSISARVRPSRDEPVSIQDLKAIRLDGTDAAEPYDGFEYCVWHSPLVLDQRSLSVEKCQCFSLATPSGLHQLQAVSSPRPSLNGMAA